MIKKYCLICGKQLIGSPARINKYCSRSCYYKSCFGRSYPNRPDSRIEKECPICHKLFKVFPYRKSAKFCSTECYAISMEGTSKPLIFPPGYVSALKGRKLLDRRGAKNFA